jgi:hypothetical protein
MNLLAPAPEGAVSWADPRLRSGWLALSVAALVAVAFLPGSLTNGDEYYYAGQAFVLSHGRIVPQSGDPLPVPELPPARAFKYPIAWPALLAVSRVFSFRAMFLVALLAHVAGGAAVARMLVRRGAPAHLAVVYLFHPVFWTYSRTLLSDVPATACFLLAMDAWENRDPLRGAAALGLASSLRLASLVGVVGFGLALLPQLRRRLRDAIWLGLGVTLGLAIQAAVNYRLTGFVQGSPYAADNVSLLTGKIAVQNLLLYVAGLALLPPFSLVLLALQPSRTDRWALLAAPVLVFFILYSFHDFGPSWLETLVGGQRLVALAHASLSVATSRIWSGPLVLERKVPVLLAGAVLGIAGCLASERLVTRHQPAIELLRACHADVIAYNYNAFRAAVSTEAKGYLPFTGAPPQAGWDVLVFASQPQTYRPRTTGSDPTLELPRLPGTQCRQVGPYLVYDAAGRCPQRGEPCASIATR